MPMLTIEVTNLTDCSEGCVLSQTGTQLSLTRAPGSYEATAWILLCTFLVISMQLGFAMLEVGSCRQPHRMTVLAKNVLDSSVSIMTFWVYCELFLPGLVLNQDGKIENHLVLFHSAFCANAVTICSGAMAERTHMVAYFFFAVLMSFVIYPELAIGAWANEGLFGSEFNNKHHKGYSYHDFAGSGVVHLVGGCSALVGNMLLGRRIMRAEPGPSWEDASASAAFEDPPAELLSEELESLPQVSEDPSGIKNNRWPRRFDSHERDEQEFAGSNYLQAMGMFTLWVGWYGFNAGSTLSTDGGASVTAGLVAMNTTLAASAGGVGTFIYCYFVERHLKLSSICNGILCGLVAITAPCAVATNYASVVIGLIQGMVVYPVSCMVMKKIRLDDPVDAIPVHAVCGFVGVISVAFCRPDCEYHERHGGMPVHAKFCSPDFQIYKQLIAQFWGAFTCIWWTGVISLLIWGTFALCECSVALEDEIVAEVYDLAHQLALTDPGHADFKALSVTVKRSRVAAAIFDRHGWAEGKFSDEANRPPSNMLSICHSLQKARVEKLESALEIISLPSVRCLARCICTTFAMTRLVSLRLRILPSAELTGLGAVDIDGGNLILRVKRMILNMDSKAQANNQASSEVLKNQVRELNTLVRSQDRVLQNLAKQRKQWKPVAGPLPEHDEDRVWSREGDPAQPQFFNNLEDIYGSGNGHDHRYLSYEGSGYSASSAYSGGTPPSHSSYDLALPALAVNPNVIGRPRALNSGDGPPLMGEVALQLLEVVQNQQRLLTAMHPAEKSSRSYSSSHGSSDTGDTVARTEQC